MKAAPMRVKVEQTFGILKSRFPALRSLSERLRSRRNQARAHAFVVAAVVLHNLFLSPHPPQIDLRDMRPFTTAAEEATADPQAVIQPWREALINEMLELDTDKWDLDNLEVIGTSHTWR